MPGPSKSGEGSSATKEKRSKNGCGLCRARRIKCDEGKPSCGQCVKRGFECIYEPGPLARLDITQTLARKRSRAACQTCRTLKRRCTADSEDEKVCARCKRLNLPCEWSDPKPRRKRHRSNSAGGQSQDDEYQEDEHNQNQGHSESPSKTSYVDSPEPRAAARRASTQVVRRGGGGGSSIPAYEQLLANKSELTALIRTYFLTVHQYGYLTFIHEPSFFRLLDRGKAPSTLTRLIVALVMRFAGDHTTATFRRADEIYEEAFLSIRNQMYEGFGAIELMCTLLSRTYENARGRFYSSWIMWGNAVRMMQFLSLHTFDETYPQPNLIRLNPLVKPEALRRLAWAVFYLDTLADAGRHGVHTVTETGFHLQLPADENTFLRGSNVTTAPLDKRSTVAPQPTLPWESPPTTPPQHLGISAHLIRTAAMRRRILHFNSLLKYSKDTPAQMYTSITYLETALRSVIMDLPPNLAYSENGLYVHSEMRTAFVLLHMLRHNCFLMLLWAKLNVASRAAQPVESPLELMQERIRHASGVAGIVSDIVRLNINVDPFVGVQAYTSLEILLFDPLRISKIDQSIDPKAPRFSKALSGLLQLMRRLGPVDVSMGHLRIEACRRMARCGFGDLLTHADWEAVNDHPPGPAGGQADGEFDFRHFKWHRVKDKGDRRYSEQTLALGTSQAAEALLDLGSFTANPSTANTPEPTDVLDAGGMFPEGGGQPGNSETNPIHAPAFDESPFGGTALTTGSSNNQPNSANPFENPEITDPLMNGTSASSSGPAGLPSFLDAAITADLPQLPQSNFGASSSQRNNLGLDSLLQNNDQQLNQNTNSLSGVMGNNDGAGGNAGAGTGAGGQSGGMQSWADVRRWVDLDYNSDRHISSLSITPALGDGGGDDNGIDLMDFGGGADGFGGLGMGLNGVGGVGSGGDDFNRFLEQAGYAGAQQEGSDPLSWLGLVEQEQERR